jgi:hypothetical protein
MHTPFLRKYTPQAAELKDYFVGIAQELTALLRILDWNIQNLLPAPIMCSPYQRFDGVFVTVFESKR